MAAGSRDDDGPAPAQNITSLAIGFVFIFIGIPVWWKTTEIYRVSLSHTEIEALPSTHITSLVDLEIVTCLSGDDASLSKLALFGQRLKEAMEVATERTPFLTIKYRGNVRSASDAELSVIGRATDVSILDRNLKDLRLNHEQELGRVVIYVISNNLYSMSSPYVGQHRSAFLSISSISDLEPVIPVIDKLVRFVFINEPAIFQAFLNARSSTRLKPDKESMRAYKPAPEYQLSFTLLNPSPDQDAPVEWDIAGATRNYLQPLQNKLKPFASLVVDSQVLYYVSLPMRPHFDAAHSRFYLSLKDLPHIVNPIEGKLVSHVNTRPIMHFIVYIPPPEHSPLFIYDDAGNPTETNAFISARWGGMVIVNPPRSDTESISLDMHPIMEVFISQIRSLLNFESKPAADAGKDFVFATPRNCALNEWELSSWVRRRAIENIATSSSTLKSLSELLEKIQNIVINDEIGQEVEKSLKACQKSIELMSANRLEEAFVSAREALVSSEKAFFDPSLLELLYFPDDQKFAIYMPLFLPIGLPIITSLFAALKWLKVGKQPVDLKKQN